MNTISVRGARGIRKTITEHWPDPIALRRKHWFLVFAVAALIPSACGLRAQSKRYTTVTRMAVISQFCDQNKPTDTSDDALHTLGRERGTQFNAEDFRDAWGRHLLTLRECKDDSCVYSISAKGGSAPDFLLRDGVWIEDGR
ncbi:MAG: hypothetical protein ACHQPI_09360 [Thermoanaerobaculia bacterium]